MKSLILVAAALTMAAGTSHAYTFSEVSTQSWTGSGDNQAMMVVDFGGGHSYAFGYKFGGSPTSWDMFKSIVENSGSTFGYTAGPTTLFDATGGGVTAHGEIYSWGTIIEGIGYDGFSIEDHFYTTGEVVTYWNSPDGVTWNSSSVGITDRILTDGAWDGYTGGRYDANFNFIGDAPAVPTPEPATMAIMAVGAGLLMKRNRRSKKA